MDIKKMLIDIEAMKHLESDEFSDMLATKMNDKINIPFVKEEKEQVFFEEVMDIVTDMLSGIFKKK